ncbi:MAG: selenium-dependent molybdenum cofactor biosynthesis protein YqeB [Syntrophorhabdaceae bacterium]|nr:selenium-dependent molybdenum cofactor biosynthesis protein YqeB [Syntrophorhabdaceae bacterium]
MKNLDVKILIKGAGEMATGIAHRLFMSNFKRILMTEIEKPLSVRRFVAFSEAVYENLWTVEGVTAELIRDIKEIERVWEIGRIGVIVDPEWSVVHVLKPHIVIDAIMAKRNTGTQKDEAPIVIGVGPGFNAPHDCHAAIESNRGHNLGRVYYEGSTEPHTGIPGPVMGFTSERVLRSPTSGIVRHVKKIGDEVKKGDVVMYIDETPVLATINGILRGLIREIYVTVNEKIGDIEPRGKKEYCYTISEKARAIGGGALEAIMHFLNKEVI